MKEERETDRLKSDALQGSWRIMTGERTPRISSRFRQLQNPPFDYTK